MNFQDLVIKVSETIRKGWIGGALAVLGFVIINFWFYNGNTDGSLFVSYICGFGFIPVVFLVSSALWVVTVGRDE
jgi:hypothetical protein